MAFLFDNELDSHEFKKLISELPGGDISNRNISHVVLKNQSLLTKSLERIHFKSCKWESIDANEMTLRNIIFEDCELNNVNMRNNRLINVQFLNTKLTNVVMNNSSLQQVKFNKTKLISTDPNIDNSYNGINADDILFEECDLTNIGFYRSKGIFHFINSRLYDVSGQSLSEGSALYFHNVKGSLLNFDRSNLTKIEVINSVIDKRSSAGGGNVKNIRVENSKLEFAISDNSNVDSIIYKNSGDVIVGGGSNVKNTRISDCPKGTSDILVGSNNFDLIEIENCKDLSSIFFADSIGKRVIIRNSEAYEMDFRDSKIENLVLDKVHIHTSLEYTNTEINHLKTSDLEFGKNMEIYKDDSNVTISPDISLDK